MPSVPSVPSVPAVPLLSLAEEAFVSLTTFRRSGDRVATPVWVARDDDALLVWTVHDSGKVKRLRNDPRVELRPCGRLGGVDDDAPTASGVAEILSGASEVEAGRAAIKAKYGVEFAVVTGIERLGRDGRAPRVILRITES